MKVLVCGHSVASVLLFLVLKYQLSSVDPFYWEVLVLINSGCTGFFVYTIIPLGLDLGSSCSFPNCTESSSNGLLIISGQALGLVLTLLMRALARKVCIPLEEEGQKVGMLGMRAFEYYQSNANHTSIDSDSVLDNCPANRVDYDYTSELPFVCPLKFECQLTNCLLLCLLVQFRSWCKPSSSSWPARCSSCSSIPSTVG